MSIQSVARLWDDVRVDPDATDELVRQLVATAGALGEAIGVLEGDGPVIADDWGGPHRDAFDVEREQLADSGRALIEQLLATASTVTATLAAAEGEQQLRMRLRDRAMAAESCEARRPC